MQHRTPRTYPMSTKEKIYNQLQSQLQEKIAATKQLMESHKESLQSDTKSTAGDKHETGRAMIQMEYEASVKQWNTANELLVALNRIDPTITNNNKVGLGSLVYTNQGNYYLTVSLGKITLETDDYFAISFASPIGKLLRGKKVDDKFVFMNKEYKIKTIN